MFDINQVFAGLGLKIQPEPPYEFEIDGLGSLVFNEDCTKAHVVLAHQAEPLAILDAVAKQPRGDLAIYISCTPGGRVCYHVLAAAEGDQSGELLGTLDKLLVELGGE